MYSAFNVMEYSTEPNYKLFLPGLCTVVCFGSRLPLRSGCENCVCWSLPCQHAIHTIFQSQVALCNAAGCWGDCMLLWAAGLPTLVFCGACGGGLQLIPIF